MSSVDKKTLWGPMTTKLDFGAEPGTVIRLKKGDAVRVVGDFYRVDSEFIKGLQSTVEWHEKNNQEANAHCNRAAIEKYPCDTGWKLSARVEKLADELIKARAEIISLHDQLRSRKIQIDNLCKNVDYLKSEAKARVKQMRLVMVNIARNSIDAIISAADVELEKPDVC